MSVSIIGIDCATRYQKVGLARGDFDHGVGRICELVLPKSDSNLVETICQWIQDRPCTLIALDAPLGWPWRMGEELYVHNAGDCILTESQHFFHRETDEFIHQVYGKKPLEVGANLIARTAHSALRLLDQVRQDSGCEIPLAWDPGDVKGVSAIEVYPAVTLRAYQIQLEGYKRREGMAARRVFLRRLGNVIELPKGRGLLETHDDVLDAAICVLAGVDYLKGDVHLPKDLNLAKKEGWIWVKKMDD